MKIRGAALQSALGLAGLGAVYLTWQRPQQAATGEVMMLDLGRGDLARIHYEDGTKWVELERRRDSSGAGIWIKQGKVDRPLPDGGVPAPGSESKPPPRELRASEGAEKLFERFEPMRASRGLGALDPAKLRELGLQDSTKVLELDGRTGKHSFRISTSVLGAGSPYLKSEQDGRVYLIGNTAIADVESAPVRLVDRQLHTFKLPEVDTFAVKVNDKRREFVIKATTPTQPTVVAPKKSPSKPDEFARNWHDKIWHIVVLDVLGKGDTPPSGEPTIALRVEYANHGKPVGWLELGSPPASSSASPRELYARSEHTAGWVKVHSTVDDQLKEATKVVSEQ